MGGGKGALTAGSVGGGGAGVAAAGAGLGVTAAGAALEAVCVVCACYQCMRPYASGA